MAHLSRKHGAVILLVVSSACSAGGDTFRSKAARWMQYTDVCYDGCDINPDPHTTPSKVVEEEEAVAAIVECKRLRRKVGIGGTVRYELPRRLETVSEKHSLCPGQLLGDIGPLTKQARLADCTAFLTGSSESRTLVSAGHCADALYLKKTVAVFGFRTSASGDFIDSHNEPKRQFGPGEVFAIERSLTKQGTGDWAFIELSASPAPSRPRLTLECNNSLKSGDQVYAIGHPLGATVAYTSNARVVEISDNHQSFRATLDTFWRNSGSPVLRPNGGVLGILLSGAYDFVPRALPDGGSCNEVKHCPEVDASRDCAGEQVLDIGVVCEAWDHPGLQKRWQPVVGCSDGDFAQED